MSKFPMFDKLQERKQDCKNKTRKKKSKNNVKTYLEELE